MFGAGAAAITLLTPIVRAMPELAWLPDPIEWYIRPTPGHTNFTLFPWAGFVFAGAAVGVVIEGLRLAGAKRLQVTLAVAGVLATWLAYEASLRPSLFARSDYWTSSPSFFLLRVGLLTLLLPLSYAWTNASFRHKLSSWSPLEEIGRASLFVYWIHVEMVYGFFSRPIRRSLSLEGALVAYVLFTAFLLALVRLKSWVVEERAIYLTDNKSVI
jgi:fucose 4-O-acetylase-like acetyltransferase